MNKELSLVLYKNNQKELLIEKIKYDIDNKTISFEYDNIQYKLIDQNIFERENREFLFKLNIKEKECIYKLKETNTTLSIKVINSKIEIKEKEIIIIYELETEPATNKIIIRFL